LSAVQNYEIFVNFHREAGIMAEKSGVQSVERIFQLIEHLAAHPTGVSLQRLAEETGLAKSTVHRLLASLVGLGYVVQDEENGHYRLTLKMFELSSGIVNSMEIMDVAKAHLERLSQRTGEAVHLVIRDAQDIVYIYKTESGPMRMSSRVGLRSPLYCTGVGKAILATLPPEEVEDVWNHSSLKKLTSRTVVDLTEMQDQLAEVRANGYAIDDEENEMGVRCVAVAIPGPDGRAESAFSISGLAPYMTPERIRRVAALALDTRTDILADLGVGRKG
jgi:DNA-binding IclR family transcriptional regulator